MTADLTVVMCGIYGIDWRWQLEQCGRYGIKALIKGVSSEQAAQPKDDQAVWGYYIMAEPTEVEQYGKGGLSELRRNGRQDAGSCRSR